VEAQRSIRTLVATAIERNKALLSNATSIVGTVGVASALGFVYWAVAAKLFSPSAVGLGSAATSAMTLLGTVGMFGLGPMLMGELPRRRVRGPLVSASLVATGIGSLVLGIGFAVIAPRFATALGFITGSLAALAMFLAGVVIIGVGKTFDQACIGMLKGGIQLSRNLIFSVVKVIALPVLAFVIHDALGVGIMLSWIVGAVVSLAWIAIRLSSSGVLITPKPDWDSLRALGKVTLAHNWLNLAIFVPPALMPVIVTSVVSPAANAAFYVSWMIANFLYIIPSSLSIVLFTVASADTSAMAAKLRFTMRLSMYLGVPGILALFAGGHLILEVFGRSYAANGTLPLWLFAACYLPTVPVSHYIAVCRTTDKVPLAATVLTTSSAIQIAAAAAGGALWGLNGLSIALVSVKFIEGLITLPAVLRAMRYRTNQGQARATDPRAAWAERWPGEPRDVPSRRSLDDSWAAWGAPDDLTRRQREGIAALIALSMDTSSTGPLPAVPDYIQRDGSRRENASPPQHRQPPVRGRHRAPVNPFAGGPNGYPRQSDGNRWSPPNGYPRPQPNGPPPRSDGHPPRGDQRRVPEYSHGDEYWSRR
jgi:O-antigen/teichoic acid export membrane protein